MKGIETLKAFIASHYEPNASDKLEQERINQIEVIDSEELWEAKSYQHPKL